MEPTAAPRRDRSGRLLVFVLALVLGSDLVTLAISQRWSREIDSLSDRIVHNTSPSIERLAALRGSVARTELALSHHLAGSGSAADAIAALDELHHDVQAYLALPEVPGEPKHWTEVETSWEHFDEASREVLARRAKGDDAGAHVVYSTRVLPAGERMVGTALATIDFLAGNGRAAAARIKWIRHRAIVSTNALAVLFTLLGIAGVFLLRRQQRAWTQLIEERASFLEERSAELEQFAGRVAHDIRNPLAAANTAAYLIETKAPDDRTRENAGRVLRNLARADAIISALLEFARAGARPDPGARTPVAETLLDYVSSVEPEAARIGIELVVEPVPDVEAACSAGVYLSLVGNLLRNAMKYMGSGPSRRIVVRVTADDRHVRTEIADTGPGIPADVLGSLFEPWFRGPTRGQAGLGLGLATVKKLAEGHGGSVGVSSRVGAGSTFWFVLPARRVPDAPSPDERGRALHH